MGRAVVILPRVREVPRTVGDHLKPVRSVEQIVLVLILHGSMSSRLLVNAQGLAYGLMREDG